MPVTHVNRLATAISNAPSLAGNLTIATALTNYRTFGAAQDGLSFNVAILDGSAWEVRTGCVYTHSTKTLTRGSLEESSAGTALNLSASAVVTETATAGWANDLEARLLTTSEVAQTRALVSGAGYSAAHPLNIKLSPLWQAMYSGITAPSGTPANAQGLVKLAVFGDSVGNSKPQFIRQRLRAMLGDGGSMLGGWNLSGGVTSPVDTMSGTYWINSIWYVVPSGGQIDFLSQVGGGRVAGTTLKLYYVTEPGAGTFKLQSNGGAGFADEAGYTSVNASAGSVGLGIITLTKSAGSTWGLRVVGLTGTVRFLFGAVWGAGGLFQCDFSVGGLPLDTARQTPAAIVSGVLNDIGFDACFAEWKDNAEFAVAFSSWASLIDSTVTKKAAWIYIGTTPELIETTTGSWNVANNAIQKTYCDGVANYYYFDGYTPLSPYSRLVALGWNGDGTHLDPRASGYIASLLWDELGFDTLTPLPSSKRVLTDSVAVDNGTVSVRGPSSVEVGRLGKPGDNTDFWIYSNRSVVFADLGTGTAQGRVRGGGETSWFGVLAIGGTYGVATPCFNDATLNGLAALQLGQKDASSTLVPLRLQRVYLGTGGVFDATGSGTPEGAITAPIGSTFRRSDGGAGTSFYVKESGSGNTGWVGK